jgi:hypothetical protein
MAKTPKTPKKVLDFELPDAEEFAAMFEDDPEAPDLTDGEKAAAQMSMLPMPILTMMAEQEKLAAFLVAINPGLTLEETDKGLDQLEEMLIMALADVRSQRREIKSGPGSANIKARASTIHGVDAMDLLEDFLSEALPIVLPGLSEADMKRNLKMLKAGKS